MKKKRCDLEMKSVFLGQQTQFFHAITFSAARHAESIVLASVGGTLRECLEFARLTHFQQSARLRIVKNNDFALYSKYFAVKSSGSPYNAFRDTVLQQQAYKPLRAGLREIAAELDVLLGFSVIIRRKMLARLKEPSFTAQIDRVLSKYQRCVLEASDTPDCAALVRFICEECNDIFFQHAVDGNFEPDTHANAKWFDRAIFEQFGAVSHWIPQAKLPVFLQVFFQKYEPQSVALETMVWSRPDPDDLFDDFLSQNELNFTYRIGNEYFDTTNTFHGGFAAADAESLMSVCKRSRYDAVTQLGVQRRRFRDEDIVASLSYLSKASWRGFLGFCLRGTTKNREKAVFVGIAPLVNIVCRTVSLYCSQFAYKNVTYAYLRAQLPVCWRISGLGSEEQTAYTLISAKKPCAICGRLRHYILPLIGSLTALNCKYDFISDEVLRDLFTEGYCVVDCIAGRIYYASDEVELYDSYRRALQAFEFAGVAALVRDVPAPLLRPLLQQYYLLQLTQREAARLGAASRK